jgi:RNA polymerase-binding transcription factor DksA
MSIDTSHFREELEEHRTRLLATISHHDIGGASLSEETGELLSSSSTDNHLADTASETYDREFDEGVEEDARARLCEVDEALARIESGQYGTCRVCGAEIPLERLEVVPWTTLCVEDARKLAR